MEKDILDKLKLNNRDEAIRFLKSLWNEKPQLCPLCDGKLDFIHKKAKKSNCDWICTVCGERYDTIKMKQEMSLIIRNVREGRHNTLENITTAVIQSTPLLKNGRLSYIQLAKNLIRDDF